MQIWSKLEYLVAAAGRLREHLCRATGYGDEDEIRRLRAELAFIAKQRRDAVSDLNDQIALRV